jgi:hypothetical protein
MQRIDEAFARCNRAALTNLFPSGEHAPSGLGAVGVFIAVHGVLHGASRSQDVV